MTEFAYKTQNPWITFEYRVRGNSLWMHLGEAFSKCQHLAGTPLPPGVAVKLSEIYLRKGALATAAIEGNTLSESQAEAILSEGAKLPPSQEYLERELKNLAGALSNVDESAVAGTRFKLTPEWIKEQNRLVLDGLELDDYVKPGEYTERQLAVGPYRAAPPSDVPYLVERLCDWINDLLSPLDDPDLPLEQRFQLSFFSAILGHLYIAWIHPFGDGNGRTARLVECALLAHSGVVPWVSSNVLSDFYNRTRSRYYRRLDAASKAGDVDGFVAYSAEGFVDMLREQIDTVRGLQRNLAWTNYVHECFNEETTGKPKDRRRSLVLAMSGTKPTSRKDMVGLTPELAAAYAGHDEKMLTRDLTVLRRLGLIRSVGKKGYLPNIHIMDAFRPIAPAWAPGRQKPKKPAEVEVI